MSRIDWSKVLTSKMFWLGVVMIAGAIIEYLMNLPTGVTVLQIASGILTIIFRFLTNDSLLNPPRES